MEPQLKDGKSLDLEYIRERSQRILSLSTGACQEVAFTEHILTLIDVSRAKCLQIASFNAGVW